MSAVQDIVGQVPIDQLAQQVGADEESTRAAVEQIVPSLLGGLQANAQDPAGQASLLGALGDHQGETPAIDSVDTGDGQRIVDNVFGGNTDEVVNRLGGMPSGAGGDIVKKLLPILAPIVLNYLSKQVLGRAGGGAAQPTPQQTQPDPQQPQQDGSAPADQSGDAGSGGLGDILGQVLGGALGGGSGSTGGTAGQSALPGGLGDILGGLLGGGKR